MISTAQPPTETPADRFFSAAIPRMLRFILVLGAIFTLYAAWRSGLLTALGFAAGAIIAYLSFRSLNKAVQSLAAASLTPNSPPADSLWSHGFFLRYLLAGIVAYVIFTSSLASLSGLSVWIMYAGSGHADGSGL